MSGVVKSVGKVFKKVTKFVKEHKKEIIAAAAVYFAVSAASGAFAAPEVGAGGELAASVGTDTAFNTATTFTTEAGASVAGDVAATAAETGAAGIDLSLAGGAGTEGMALGSTDALNLAGGAEAGGIVNTAKTAAGAVGEFVKEYPVATMLLGSGVSSAYTAKQMKESDAASRAERLNRGTMGFDYRGDYAGKPGIVNTQRRATVAPTAPGQQKVRPIARSNLAKIENQDIKRRV